MEDVRRWREIYLSAFISVRNFVPNRFSHHQDQRDGLPNITHGLLLDSGEEREINLSIYNHSHLRLRREDDINLHCERGLEIG